MAKKSKAIIQEEELQAEMRNLLMWFVKTNAVVVVLGGLGTLVSTLLIEDKTAIIGGLIAFGSILGSQLINYILYRQEQINGQKV